jgi:type I restriction enzyme M protein
VLFINASEHFDKGKRQNALSEGHIEEIIETYKHRKEEERYSRKVSMEEIEKNGYNLNISRYVSTAEDEVQIDLTEVNMNLNSINEQIEKKTKEHNDFLSELGLATL